VLYVRLMTLVSGRIISQYNRNLLPTQLASPRRGQYRERERERERDGLCGGRNVDSVSKVIATQTLHIDHYQRGSSPSTRLIHSPSSGPSTVPARQTHNTLVTKLTSSEALMQTRSNDFRVHTMK